MVDKVEGKVKWFNRMKGYGFIAGDDGNEYFVHHTAVEKGAFLRDNDVVSFEPAETEKGNQAQSVVLLQKGSELAAEPAEAEPEAEEPAPEEEPEAEKESEAEEPAPEEEPEAEPKEKKAKKK